MDHENQISVEINSADADELDQLQGVGSRLAERIIEARPFESIDDLTRVRGISEKDVERLRPFLTLADTPMQFEDVVDEANPEEAVPDVELNEFDEPSEDMIEETEDEASFEEAESETVVDVASDDFEAVIENVNNEMIDADEAPEDIELVEFEDDLNVDTESVLEELDPVEETVVPESAPQPETITRGGACGLIFIGGLLTLVLSVIITLGILASVNNGQLSYASPYQISALRSQTESLSVQANTLAEDIDGMRTRIDNLEALSGRVNDVETEVEVMQDDVAGLQAVVVSMQTQYDDLATQIEGLDEEIETLTVQGNRFESFLEGLRSLMEGLFPENLEVEETP